jgi:hypothetical protein
LKNLLTISSETFDFNPQIELDNNLWILDKEGEENQFDRTTIINVIVNRNYTKKIRVDWCSFSSPETVLSTLFISETNKLFFGASCLWGIINLINWEIERQEHVQDFWSFERVGDTIVVIEELRAESFNLEARTIDKVPIDPPFESKDFDDRIEFDSPVYGKQTLKLK